MDMARTPVIAGVLALLGCTVALLVQTQCSVNETGSWELQTAPQRIHGARHLENDKLDAGISALVALHRASPGEKLGPILTNLCLAYTLKRDYAVALDFCEQAVSLDRISRDAYNNLGVLHALQGDYDDAITDFLAAACEQSCPDNLDRASASPSGIVLRNLERARERRDAMMGKRQ